MTDKLFSLNRQQQKKFKDYGIMTLIGWLAFALRVYNLNGRFTWYDESFAVLYAKTSVLTMLYGTATSVKGAAADIHPLFYYTLLHFWMNTVGQSMFAVRFLSVVFSVFTVFVVYSTASYLFNRLTGTIAAFIMAVSPFAVYYAQETRMYALLGLVAICATYLFARAWREGKWRFWVMFGFTGALTVYAHNLGAMYMAAFDLWALYQWIRQKKPVYFRQLVVSHIVMLVVFSPWLMILLKQINRIQQGYWIRKPGIVELLQTLFIFHFAYDNQVLPPALLYAAFFFSVLMITLLLTELWQRRTGFGANFKGAILLLLFLAVGPVVITFLVSQIKPVYIVRPLLPSAQIYYILAAVFFAAGKMPRLLKWAIALPMMVVIFFSLYNHYTYIHSPRAPFDEIAAYLRKQSQGVTGAIVHNNKMTYFSTHYFDRALPQAFLADKAGSPADTLAYPTQAALKLFAEPNVQTAVDNAQYVWYVAFKNDEMDIKQIPNLQWLTTHFRQTHIRQFEDVIVYEFEQAP